MERWCFIFFFLTLLLKCAKSTSLEYPFDLLLCNSTTAQANASRAVTFDSPLYWGDVSTPSWAVTVVQGDDSTQRTVWYDTAGRNYSDDLQLGFDACAFWISGLPLNTLELGQDDPGDCSMTLSQSCRDALTQTAANVATSLTYTASPGPYSNLSAGSLPYICGDIFEPMNTALAGGNVPECNQDLGIYPSKDEYGVLDVSILALTGYNTSIQNSSCTLASAADNKIFYPAFHTVSPGTNEAYNDATYDITPVLTVFMPVTNYLRTGGFGSANSLLSCVRANQYSKGSVVSPVLPAGSPYPSEGGLSKGAIAGICVGALVGVALIVAVGFLWLRSRKRRLAEVKEVSSEEEVMKDSESIELESNAVAELSPVDRKIEAGGATISELSPTYWRHEADGGMISELAGNEKTAELDGATTSSYVKTDR